MFYRRSKSAQFHTPYYRRWDFGFRSPTMGQYPLFAGGYGARGYPFYGGSLLFSPAQLGSRPFVPGFMMGSPQGVVPGGMGMLQRGVVPGAVAGRSASVPGAVSQQSPQNTQGWRDLVGVAAATPLFNQLWNAASRLAPGGSVKMLSPQGALLTLTLANFTRDMAEAVGLSSKRPGQWGWDLNQYLQENAFDPSRPAWRNWGGALLNSFNTIGSPKALAAVGWGSWDAARQYWQAQQRSRQLDMQARQAQSQGRLQHWRGYTTPQQQRSNWWRAFWQSL